MFWKREEGIYEWFCVCVLYTIATLLDEKIVGRISPTSNMQIFLYHVRLCLIVVVQFLVLQFIIIVNRRRMCNL